ncbi:hypothetical protein J6590_029486 [Homalodisca vitripennis]|nr:hypothetical protein J6590_029486 [Homalodisca vitripennis]
MKRERGEELQAKLSVQPDQYMSRPDLDPAYNIAYLGTSQATCTIILKVYSNIERAPPYTYITPAGRLRKALSILAGLSPRYVSVWGGAYPRDRAIWAKG